MRWPLKAVPAILSVVVAIALAAPLRAQTPQQYRDDAVGVEKLVNDTYAYLDHLPGLAMPMNDVLRLEAEAVTDRRSLLRYAERALFTLADHHAIAGSSFADSWSVVPSYADLWIERERGDFVITAVRPGSPAAGAHVRPGDRLIAVDGVQIAQAVAAIWSDLGLEVTPVRADYAARVLAAGRRDRPRTLSVLGRNGRVRQLVLPNLYMLAVERPPIETRQADGALVIRFNDSLGREDTLAAFDAAMATAAAGQPIVIDLTDTASGGNTVVARGIMGWFVDRPTPYQVHTLPAEERRTGVPRQWIEQVLPRPGRHHDGAVTVRVGRWTGSMGEGLAIGFDALGARVVGEPMAGLLGAVYDQPLPHSGLVLKLPGERLSSVDGAPREDFRPRPE
jgi:C-terminal processing protease CtpA/Prc